MAVGFCFASLHAWLCTVPITRLINASRSLVSNVGAAMPQESGVAAQAPTVPPNAPSTRGPWAVARQSPNRRRAVPSFRKQPYPLPVPQSCLVITLHSASSKPSECTHCFQLSSFHFQPSSHTRCYKIQPRASSKTVAILVLAPHSRTPLRCGSWLRLPAKS